jgi:signal transduction histidine kinase
MNDEKLVLSPLLAGLSRQELDWLKEQSETIDLPQGEMLIHEGDEGDSAFVILDGELEVSKRSGPREVVLSVRRSGDVIGEMALLTKAPRMATVRATQDSRLLRIPADAFDNLLLSHPSATLSILQTVTSRLKNTEALLRQGEKMAALGRLAAGLAHELNNPAAAVQRSTAQLEETLAEWWGLTFALMNAEGQDLQDLHTRIARPRAQQARQATDALERIDREQAIQEWLEGRGVPDPWQLSPSLAASGWTLEGLDELAEDFAATSLPQVVRWLAAGGLVYGLLDEVRQGAGRISEIVKAVKSYTYLDQAPIQEVDVHEGLESTLVMLRHKLKTGVEVTRDYASDLPHIEAYASELNQVWTNLIDNAIDAMQGHGELILRTYAREGRVWVEIQDSGPGIPPEIQQRIFEPFFTTKPPGSGSGLGLHIAYDIIVNKHHGEIHLTSRPGATCFQVVLPVRLKEPT